MKQCKTIKDERYHNETHDFFSDESNYEICQKLLENKFKGNEGMRVGS